jgi:GxxExxY protein
MSAENVDLDEIIQTVFDQLGYYGKESFYQRAMMLEFNARGIVVDSEKSISTYYIDSKGNRHTISNDRIDLYVHVSPTSKMVLELKHSDSMKEEFVHQMHRYIDGLCVCEEPISEAYIICFPKSKDKLPFKLSVDHFHIRSVNPTKL